VSITGQAEIIDDRDRVKQIWSIYEAGRSRRFGQADEPRQERKVDLDQ